MSKLSKKRDYWAAVVTRYNQGNQTQNVFCASEGINVSTFKYWLTRSKETGKPLKHKADKSTSFSRVSLRQEKALSSYQVKLPNGVCCGIPRYFEPSEVITLLEVLAQC